MTHRLFRLLIPASLAMSACAGGSGSAADAGGDMADVDVADTDAMAADAAACPNGQALCDGSCIDPLANREYCGATTCEDNTTDGNRCAPGFVCDGAGSCEAFVCQPTSGGGGAVCNPVTQAGCEAGEKCAQLVTSASPFLASTACVPDGTVTGDGTCTICGNGGVGYDNCVAGFDCLRGRCAEICTAAGGDTCRTDGEAFGEGSYCTLYADLFSDEIGLCVPGCDPTIDSVVNGTVINTQCGADNGCYLNVGRGVAACSGTPASAANVKQNDVCYGPAFSSCYLNGCASGFSPILPDEVGVAATTNTCSRYCTPADTYIGQTADRSGVADKCGATAMQDNGSGSLGGIVQECRFIQSFYGEPLNPETVGMCVPVNPWYNCAETYDFTGIMNAVAGAANTAEANTAFDNFCYGESDPLDTVPILPRCDGLGFGCISLATRQPLFDLLDGTTPAPANNQIATHAWLKARLEAPATATAAVWVRRQRSPAPTFTAHDGPLP